MEFKDYTAFPPSLIALKKKGGQYQRAAEAVEALRGRISAFQRGEAAENPLHGLRFTKHGESRIQHAVKYDLSQHARLVTLQTENICVLLFAGTHDDTDRWLDKNTGLQLVVDKGNRALETYVSLEADAPIGGGARGAYARPLYTLLSQEQFDWLADGIPHSIAKKLEYFYASNQDSELKQLLSPVADVKKVRLICDVFSLLAGDRVQQAAARMMHEKDAVTTIGKLDPSRIPKLVDSDILRGYATDDPIYSTLLRRFASDAEYRDWMLFMHPDQERVVSADFDGPAKLVGVSGSGKTCVVVRRAIRLALKYPVERILIVTLNKALATLIDDLVSSCAPDEVRARIDVRSFFVLSQELLRNVAPEAALHIDEHTAEKEHVDEIWQEFYRCEHNNDDAAVFRAVHDSLLARNCSAERYLREEADWIRSALTPYMREEYLTIKRSGRRYNISQQFRRSILEGLLGWETKMKDIGLIDTLGIAQLLSKELGYLAQPYRCILVDEVQDLGNVELEIVHAIMQAGENNLFLTGDAAQAVTAKYQRLSEIGIAIPAVRTHKLSRNYRNSADVLDAAYSVLHANLSEELIENENLDILDPESSSFRGTTPLILEAPNFRDEIRYSIALAREKIAFSAQAKVCLAFCGYSLEEMRRYGKRLGMSVLDGRRNLDEDSIFLSDLANTKGFEFDLVIVLNCSGGVLPDARLPEEESWRDVAMLYVAMTRAKLDLVISWSGEPSPIFHASKDYFLDDKWDAYIEGQACLPNLSVPEHMEDYREEAVRKPWRNMSGAEFLYTPEAIGLSTELIEKLRELVWGPGQIRQGQHIKWANLGSAVTSCRTSANARRIWGPEMSRQLIALADRLSPST